MKTGASIFKFTLLLSGFLILYMNSYAAIYTATSSGVWSDGSTWGGTAPSFNLTTDQVIIPNGVTVTMDNSVSASGALATISVMGTLTSNSSKTLTLGSLSTLSGSGNINVGTIDLQTGSATTFSGSLTAGTLSTSVASLQTTANITVNQMLTLGAGTLSLQGGSSLSMASNSTINISGGLLAMGGGTLNLSNPYNVSYAGGSATTGLELSGSGLNNVTVNVSSGNTVTLAGNLNVTGTLTLSSGALVLNGHNLNLSGSIGSTGTGSISSTAASNISVNIAGSTGGGLNFGGASTVGAFAVNVGAGNQLSIQGNLIVANSLQLGTGTLNFSNANLTISGTLSGSGNLSGSSTANLTVNTAGGLTGLLNFATGAQVVHNLTIDVDSGNSVAIGSDVAVMGTLALTGGSVLDITGYTLTIGNNGALTGTGSLNATAGSGLHINATGGLTTPIAINGQIGTFAINVGAGNSVSLGSSIVIVDSLNLKTGTLMLNGFNLSISGDLPVVNGNISATAPSSIAINTAGGLDGSLNFGGSTSVNNFIVNVGAGNTAHLNGGYLNVTGVLQLSSGVLDIGSTTLVINGTLSGSGMLSGTNYSGLIVSATGGLTGSLVFAPGGQMLDNLTVNVGTGNTVTLGSNLTVNSMVTLTGGSKLNISGQTLTLAASSDLAGTGSFTTDGQSQLIINSASGLTGSLSVDGSIGTLVVNVGSGHTVNLATDVTVTTLINLQSGALNLMANNLNINGNIAAAGNGTISSSAYSNISVATASSPSGSLQFTTGANTVENFTVNIGGNGSLMLGSDAEVDGVLDLMGGTVNVGSSALNIASTGSISGASATNYVIASGTGHLSLQVPAGNANWTIYPVGTATAYTPVALQANAGATSGPVDVSVQNGIAAQGTTGTDLSLTQPSVNVTYAIEPETSTGNNINVQLWWSAGSEVNAFNHASAYVSHFTGGSWDLSATASATAQAGGMFSLTRNNLTSFSPFAVFGSGAVTTAIDEAAAGTTNQLQVYPNPTTGHLFITNTGNLENLNIDIIDITGRLMASYQLTDFANGVSLDKLIPGNYFVKFYNEHTSIVKHVTKL